MSEFTRLARYVRPHLGTLGLAVLLAALVGVFEAARTALLQPLLNGLASAAGPLPVSAPTGIASIADATAWLPTGPGYWYALLGLMIGFTLFRGVAQFFANYLLTSVGQRVIVRLRQELFGHLLNQSATFFARHRTADLTAHIISDVEKMQLAVSLYLADALREGFTLLCLLVLAFLLSWKLTLAALLVVPFVAVLTAKFGKKLRRTSTATQEGLQEVLAVAQETLSGQRVVKAFGAEAYEKQRFLAVSEALRKANLRTARALFLPSPIMDLIGFCAGAVVVLYTHHLVASGEITIGGVTATLGALLQLYDPIRKLSQTHNAYSQVAAAADRVFRLLDEHTEVVDPPGAPLLPAFSDRIEVSGVGFTYPGADEPALRDVSFTVEKGTMVALVGPSGGGKSTLLNLLLRFYDCSDGAILVDGTDIRQTPVGSLRGQIALVSQDVVLFRDSFRNNIAYGRPDIAPEAVQRAAEAAFAHEFILERGGYDASVGEAGGELSGGQRQRVAIARALLKDAPILLLDEATSALDSESEQKIQEALANLTRERTTLVIAHRLSTVRQADKIIVLDGGRIVEEGTHTTLMARDGLYRKLYSLQFKDVPGIEIGAAAS